MKKEAINTFEEGLNYDLNPLVTPNNVLTDNVNGTFLTFNGDELSLQNDAGNTKIKLHKAPDWVQNVEYSLGDIVYYSDGKCYISLTDNNFLDPTESESEWEEITGYVQLSDGFYPIGIKEHGGVLYIVSTDKENIEFGSYPSPEILPDSGPQSGIVYSITNNIDEFLYNPKVINNTDFKAGVKVKFTNSNVDFSNVSLQKFVGGVKTEDIKKFYKIKLLQQLTTGWVDLTDQIWYEFAKYKGGNLNSGIIEHWLLDTNFNFYCQSRFKGKLQITVEIEAVVLNLIDSLELYTQDGKYYLTGTIYSGENPETSVNIKGIQLECVNGPSKSTFEIIFDAYGNYLINKEVNIVTRLEPLIINITPYIFYEPINLFRYSDNFWRNYNWTLEVDDESSIEAFTNDPILGNFLRVNTSDSVSNKFVLINLPESLPNDTYTFSVDTMESTGVVIAIPKEIPLELDEYNEIIFEDSSPSTWKRRTVTFTLTSESPRKIGLCASKSLPEGGDIHSTNYRNFRLSKGTFINLEWLKSPYEIWEDFPEEYISKYLISESITTEDLSPTVSKENITVRLEELEITEVPAIPETPTHTISINKKLVLTDIDNYNLSSGLLYSSDKYYFSFVGHSDNGNNVATFDEYIFGDPKELGIFLVKFVEGISGGGVYKIHYVKQNPNISILNYSMIEEKLINLQVGSKESLIVFRDLEVSPKTINSDSNEVIPYDLGSNWGSLVVIYNNLETIYPDSIDYTSKKAIFKVKQGVGFSVLYPNSPTYVSTGISNNTPINFGIIDTFYRADSSKGSTNYVTVSGNIPGIPSDFELQVTPLFIYDDVWMEKISGDTFRGIRQGYQNAPSTLEITGTINTTWNPSWELHNVEYPANFKYVIAQNRFIKRLIAYSPL